jgi:hypothetical protein
VVKARPLPALKPGDFDTLQREVTQIGFLEWMH